MSVVIVGAGPNLGAAIARRFGREGLSIGLVARNRDKLDALAGDLAQQGITADHEPADIRDASALGGDRVAGRSPRPSRSARVLPRPGRRVHEDDPRDDRRRRRATVEFSVLGAVAAATAVIPAMLDRGAGTILFTTGGAAINPNPLRAGVGVSFAGEVAYARMLHAELRDRGIHVGHTAIGGSIAPGGDHEPDDVAEALWRHHTQRSDFQLRLGID